jgi:phospholipid/cholesterol/gamma-HCH transport system permease protein
VFGRRVFLFFGEALRQAGVLILGLGPWSSGASRSSSAPVRDRGRVLQPLGRARRRIAGVFSAWCDLREIMPYAFGYMMSAKVGPGIVAEIGAMRISTRSTRSR